MASFKKRVRQIATAEKDVDKVLRAAKLKRCSANDTTMEMVLGIVGIVSILILSVSSWIIAAVCR